MTHIVGHMHPRVAAIGSSMKLLQKLLLHDSVVVAVALSLASPSSLFLAAALGRHEEDEDRRKKKDTGRFASA